MYIPDYAGRVKEAARVQSQMASPRDYFVLLGVARKEQVVKLHIGPSPYRLTFSLKVHLVRMTSVVTHTWVALEKIGPKEKVVMDGVATHLHLVLIAQTGDQLQGRFSALWGTALVLIFPSLSGLSWTCPSSRWVNRVALQLRCQGHSNSSPRLSLSLSSSHHPTPSTS